MWTCKLRRLTSSTVVVQIDDGVLVLVYEQVRPVKAVFGVQDALRVDRVVHHRLALEPERVERVQAGRQADLEGLGRDDFSGESDEDLLLVHVEVEGRGADTLALKLKVLLLRSCPTLTQLFETSGAASVSETNALSDSPMTVHMLSWYSTATQS